MSFWNISSEEYYDFTDNIKSFAREHSSEDIVYAESGMEVSKKHHYPVVVPTGTPMTRDVARKLVQFYCNRKKLFYNPEDLDEIVDITFGLKKKRVPHLEYQRDYIRKPREEAKKTKEYNIIDFNARIKKMREYAAAHRESIRMYGNPLLERAC